MADVLTYWNGKQTPARIVRVVVGPSPKATWWCAELEGQEREAVEVSYPGCPPFYIDNEDGSGWRKVTEGRGSPAWGHSGLPVARVLTARPTKQQGYGERIMADDLHQTLKTAEFRLALRRITEHYPPDTIAGRLAADVLAKYPNQFENADRENDCEPFEVESIKGLRRA